MPVEYAGDERFITRFLMYEFHRSEIYVYYYRRDGERAEFQRVAGWDFQRFDDYDDCVVWSSESDADWKKVYDTLYESLREMKPVLSAFRIDGYCFRRRRIDTVEYGNRELLRKWRNYIAWREYRSTKRCFCGDEECQL